MWIFPIALLIAFEALADIFAKEYSLRNSIVFWACAIAAYIIANAFWLYAIKAGSGLARGATIFSVVSAIIAVVIGLLFYKESIPTVQLIGIVIGLVALALIFWNDFAGI